MTINGERQAMTLPFRDDAVIARPASLSPALLRTKRERQRKDHAQASGAPPLPNEAPASPIIDPLAQHLTQASPVHVIDVSTQIGIQDPADTLLHAPRTYRVQRCLRASTWPKAIGAVLEVLRINRFQHQRHRSLDDLGRERGLADRALSPVVLLDPDALLGRYPVASTGQTRVHVPQVVVEVLGIQLGGHPIDPCCTLLARVAVRLV